MKDQQAKQKKMEDALEWCEDNGKSTAFTIQFIMSEAGATEDEVIEFLVQR